MVRMSDIAAKAGVSQATVSYVLNERSAAMRIGDETRLRILDVAAELGYRRNEVARNMVTGRTTNFGFLTRTPSSELSTRLLVGAQEEADDHGYDIKLLPTARTLDYKARIDRCVEQRMAGILAYNLGGEGLEYLHSEARRFRIPIALVDDGPSEHDGVRVIANNELGVRQAIEHLVQLGHRRIACVSAQSFSPPAQERERYFTAIMASMGLPLHDDSIVRGDWDNVEVISPQVTRLLSVESKRPTALLCAGDKIAMVALQTAHKLGFFVPRDLSIVGFANFQMAAFAYPPLTTVSQPFEEMGRLAVRHLLERIKNPEINAPADFVLPTRLVVRESTGRAMEIGS